MSIIIITKNAYRLASLLSAKSKFSELQDVQEQATERIKNSPEFVLPNGGVWGGEYAFLTPSQYFGHDGTATVLKRIYGFSHVECPEHGWQQCHVGHIVPASVGGVLRVERLVRGIWMPTSPKTIYTVIEPLRLVNCAPECGECNKRKAQQMSEDVKRFLKRVKFSSRIVIKD